jgi:hypothetical protein
VIQNKSSLVNMKQNIGIQAPKTKQKHAKISPKIISKFKTA